MFDTLFGTCYNCYKSNLGRLLRSVTMNNNKLNTAYGLITSNKALASVLLRSASDVKDFVSMFYKTNKYEIDDLLDYREYKIRQSRTTLDAFLEQCDDDMKIAFENNFQQYFTDSDIDMIKEHVHSGNISLATLFEKFYENIDVNILKYIT